MLLPDATLTDGVEIGEALVDPERAADGVMSLVRQTGWRELLRLTDQELLGLTVLAQQDAAALAAGHPPGTLADLHAAIAPLLPELSVDALLAAYADAFTAAPDSVVPQVMRSVALEPDTPVSRVQLWALFVDGFAVPHVATAGLLTAAIGPPVVPIRPVVATPGLQLPFIPSPVPGVSNTDFALLTAHLLPMAYAIPFELTPSNASGHEGHGGPGPTLAFRARHLPYYAPPASTTGGLPLLLPSTGNPSGVPVTWTSTTRAVLDDHGTLPPTFGTPVPTDATGAVELSYAVKAEQGDPTGPLESDVASISASVPLLALMLAHYIVPQAAWGFLSGERQTPPAIVTIEWHEEPGWYIDQQSAGGRIIGQKCGGIGGAWIADGTYSFAGANGEQTWIIEIDERSQTGTYTYTDDQTMKAFGGITIRTEGKAKGVASLTIDGDNVVHMHLRETEHTFRSTSSAGGQAQDQNAPLASFDLKWLPGGTC